MNVGYARHTTTSKDYSLVQKRLLREAGCSTIVVDIKSVLSKDRPELQRLLKSMKTGDVLIVWRLDRLAWSMSELVELVNDLSARGIGFRALEDRFDTTGSEAKQILQVFSALAAYEQALSNERIALSNSSKRRFGRKVKLETDVIRDAVARMRNGERVTELAKELEVSRATLYRAKEARGGRIERTASATKA